jgi:hypothetical protein
MAGILVILAEVLRDFSQFLEAVARIVPWLCHYCFLLNPF